MTLRFGDWKVESLSGGRFALDGGAMFGVVPKSLWGRSTPCDELNRVALETRLLLLRRDEQLVLVDTGMGRNWSSRESEIFALQGDTVLSSLAQRGVHPSMITDVVITHLHFDHAGGLTQRVRGADNQTHVIPSFPNATVHLQRKNWDWARRPTLRDRRSYRPADWLPWDQNEGGEAWQKLRRLDRDGEILPGIHVRVCDGHTPGQQVIRIPGGPDGRALVYPSDLLPTAAHLPLAWTMAYDLQPLLVEREKRAILERAVAEGDWICFVHDPEIEAATLRMEDGVPVIDEVMRLDRLHPA